MHALVISEELANDVLGAELLIKRHEEYKREIEKQWLKYEEMQRAGGDLMRNGHFMSVEVCCRVEYFTNKSEQRRH